MRGRAAPFSRRELLLIRTFLDRTEARYFNDYSFVIHETVLLDPKSLKID